MRVWLFNLLRTSPEIQTLMGYTQEEMNDQVVPRESQRTINLTKPFLVYGLGNNTNENLSEDPDHIAHRQFFQVWVHDDAGSFLMIDRVVEEVKSLLVGASSLADQVTTVRWLETSQEFSNETYNTIFRYVRFQAVVSRGVTL